MKNERIQHLLAAVIGCMLAGFTVPVHVYASDGEDYITISVDAVDDNSNLKYALDSDAEEAFTDSNEFTVPAGTSHTIYVKDAAGNITSQKYEPEETMTDTTASSYGDDEEQQINIDLELGHKEKESEEDYSLNEDGNPGTASVLNRTKADGSVDAEKVFYTFTTREGEELYLVVDQGRGTDNVYLLDTVSLGDLRVLADGYETSSASNDKEEDNLLSTLAEENVDSEPEEAQTEKPKSSFGSGLIMLLLAGIGGGIYYYLKIYRLKKDEAMDAMDAMDMDEFETEEEEEEVDFDYDDAEKERYLDELINENTEEEDLYDQDPDTYATSHIEDDEELSDSEDDDVFDDMDIDGF